jgi:hypothetical protein
MALVVAGSLVGAGSVAQAAAPQPRAGIIVPVNGGPGMQCFELLLGSAMRPKTFCVPAPML